MASTRSSTSPTFSPASLITQPGKSLSYCRGIGDPLTSTAAPPDPAPSPSAYDHAAPGEVAKIRHGGRFFDPRVPHHRRCRAVFVDHDAAAPPAIFDGAPRVRVDVYAVGFRPDGDRRRGLPLAPPRFGLVDIGSAHEPRDP